MEVCSAEACIVPRKANIGLLRYVENLLTTSSYVASSVQMKAGKLAVSIKFAPLTCAIFLFWNSNCWADPSLPTLFGDHMVLQQAREIHVWGKADPAEPITATLAGHSSNSTADAQGNWSLHLPAMRAGGPFTL